MHNDYSLRFPFLIDELNLNFIFHLHHTASFEAPYLFFRLSMYLTWCSIDISTILYELRNNNLPKIAQWHGCAKFSVNWPIYFNNNLRLSSRSFWGSKSCSLIFLLVLVWTLYWNSLLWNFSLDVSQNELSREVQVNLSKKCIHNSSLWHSRWFSYHVSNE